MVCALPVAARRRIYDRSNEEKALTEEWEYRTGRSFFTDPVLRMVNYRAKNYSYYLRKASRTNVHRAVSQLLREKASTSQRKGEKR